MLKMEFTFKYKILITNVYPLFSQFISEKVKKNLRKSPPQFREILRKLRLRQNDGFLIKRRNVYDKSVFSVLLFVIKFDVNSFSHNIDN